jgi:FAD:protein FMN transferase
MKNDPSVPREPHAARGGAGPGRREFLGMGLGALLVAAVPLASARAPRRVRYAVPAMGTVAELVAVHRDERYARGALRAAAEELRRVEAVLTRFDAASEIGRVNLSAAKAPVPVSRETAAVVEEALRWAEASGGRFDPALARVVDLWDVKHRHEPPPADAVRRLAGRALYRGVGLEDSAEGPAIAFSTPEVQLDLGGFGGGYGVDRAVEVLRAWGIRDGFVNLGGDVYALGRAEGGEPWRVGVRSPTEPETLVATVGLSDEAIATSGDYEQFFVHAGRRYHHLMDPETAAPRRSPIRSVTVRADRCAVVDAATTACFGLDPSVAGALLARVAPGAGLVHVG